MPSQNVVTTRVFKETLLAYAVKRKRRIFNEGGTSSSKTYSVLQFLIFLAQETQTPMLISVVSESLPHLKRGAMRDFFNILGETPDNNKYFNKTESVYKRPEWKGVFEFFGADDEGKVKGPRRQVLFMNEGNNIPWSTAQGLDIRTDILTLVDWNPTGEFWAHHYESDGQIVNGWLSNEDSEFIHSTYLDAVDVLPAQKIKDIESYRGKDPNWWNIYGLGLMGKIEALVYPSFGVVKDLPDGDVFYGLDFGYSGDPSVLVANVVVGDCLYSKQLIYQTGLTNDMLCREMDLMGVLKDRNPIYADSSDPRSIQEILDKHFNVKPCEKGKGSVKFGHQKVNQFRQFWTEDSVECIKEQKNFRYLRKKDSVTGNEYISDETSHVWSHGMDARRYAVSSHNMSFHSPAKQAILGTYGRATQSILGEQGGNDYFLPNIPRQLVVR